MRNLSERLKLIYSLVPNGARVCDIGTDHGYLAIELIKSGKAKNVIATDINKKPLATAKRNAEKAGIDLLDLRLCDGLSLVNESEVDTVIVAGMGGEVISKILEGGKRITFNEDVTLILQPTTSPEFLRDFLFSNGFEIKTETPISENGKLYSVIFSRFTGRIQSHPPHLSFIGKVKPDCQDGKMYIEKQLSRCFKTMTALENVPSKQKEYLFLKSVCDGITDYLKEQQNGI